MNDISCGTNDIMYDMYIKDTTELCDEIAKLRKENAELKGKIEKLKLTTKPAQGKPNTQRHV